MTTAAAIVTRALVGTDRSATVLRRRPALAVVPERRVVLGRAPFVGGVVVMLVAGLLGLLALNTALAKDAFRLHTLTVDGRALEDREQTLAQEVERLRAPQSLAEKAAALGMVQAGPPAFLRLSDGVVLGSPTPALAPEGAEAVTAGAPDADLAAGPTTKAGPTKSGSSAKSGSARTSGTPTTDEAAATPGEAR